MANKYRSVLASGGGVQPTGNAQPADVLSGKTFSNADGIDKTGTMVNNGAVSGTATPSQPYTIPAGYHNGSGTVTASGLNLTDITNKFIAESGARPSGGSYRAIKATEDVSGYGALLVYLNYSGIVNSAVEVSVGTIIEDFSQDSSYASCAIVNGITNGGIVGGWANAGASAVSYFKVFALT